MSTVKEAIVYFTLLMSCATCIHAKENAIHLGLNTAVSLSSVFSFESQFSNIFTSISSSFLSGKKLSSDAANALVGSRCYFSKKGKATRLYSNLLVGGNYHLEREIGLEQKGEINLGFSIGTYAERGKWLLGFSYDSPKNLILKLGYMY